MNISPAGIKLIQFFESCRLKAYLDTGGVWTIGWGTTKYPNGKRVQKGDICTQLEADTWFKHDINDTVLTVDALTLDHVNQNQFDALCSFTYNVGKQAYKGSTLRTKVNTTPDDFDTIRNQFMRWVYDNGAIIPGLVKRRKKEADFYSRP